MKALDAQERQRAIDAVDTLYWLGLIDGSACLMLKNKIDERTGA